jgi:hypothetical protein
MKKLIPYILNYLLVVTGAANIIRKVLVFLFSLLWATVCFAQEQPIPIIRILPEDVIKDSIHLVQQSTTNSFGVGWTYTEAGAQKMLAFREAHEKQTVREVVGDSDTPAMVFKFSLMSTSTYYVDWKKRFLKQRTDKFACMTEDDAKAIITHLESK